jgi:hypothetical protein
MLAHPHETRRLGTGAVDWWLGYVTSNKLCLKNTKSISWLGWAFRSEWHSDRYATLVVETCGIHSHTSASEHTYVGIITHGYHLFRFVRTYFQFKIT